MPLIKTAIKDGVEVHFDDEVIDNPMVRIRWCINPDALAIMKEHPELKWGLLLVAQEENSEGGRPQNIHKSVFQIVQGVERIGDGRGFLNFKAAGMHNVVVYLVASSCEKLGQPWKRLGDQVDEPERVHLWSNDTLRIETKEFEFLNNKEDTIVAYSLVKVSVPDGIFAKPLPEWAKAWLGYFLLHRTKNECAARWRLGLTLVFGWLPYLATEFVKRAWLFLNGILHFLFGGNPLVVWKEVFAPRLSAQHSSFLEQDLYEPMTEYDGWSFLKFPLIWAVLIGGTAACLIWPELGAKVLRVGGLIAATALAIITVVYLTRKETERREKEEQRTAKTKGQKGLARVEKFAVCGRDTDGPVTIDLVASSLKRKVCRNY